MKEGGVDSCIISEEGSHTAEESLNTVARPMWIIVDVLLLLFDDVVLLLKRAHTAIADATKPLPWSVICVGTAPAAAYGPPVVEAVTDVMVGLRGR